MGAPWAAIFTVLACARATDQMPAPRFRFGGYQYPAMVLYSLFLGFLGVDRLCLKFSCSGAFKLLTLGGLGVWWLVDLILLSLGQLAPYDGSQWEPSW